RVVANWISQLVSFCSRRSSIRRSTRIRICIGGRACDPPIWRKPMSMPRERTWLAAGLGWATVGIGIRGSEPILGFRVMDCFTARLVGYFIHQDSFGALRCSLAGASIITLDPTTMHGVRECTMGCLLTTATAFNTGPAAEYIVADSVAEVGFSVAKP